MVAPIITAKSGNEAAKALMGDIWTRTSHKIVGTGKDKRLVETTVRVNAASALAATGAVAVAAVGLGVTAFALGVKAKPVNRPAWMGRWEWDDNSAASSERLEAKRGSAPERSHLENIQYAVWVWPDGSYASSPLPLDRIEAMDPPARLVGGKVWIFATILLLDIREVYVREVAHWVRTRKIDKLGFDVEERPTLAEGLTGAVGTFASFPIDFTTNAISAVIQDFKESIGLP